MARILDFIKEATSQEYVVILEDSNRDSPDDWARPGFTLNATVEIGDAPDLYKLPQECELEKR